MWSIREDTRGFAQHLIAIVANIVAVRGQVELMIIPHQLRYRNVLGHVSFRVKLEADLDVGCGVLSIGMYMELKYRLGAGLHQAAGPVLENIRILRLHRR